MRCRVIVQLGALIIVILITWIITNNSFNVQETALGILGLDYFETDEPSTSPPKIKCGLEKSCPLGNFALRIKSGAANVVGPTICFEGQTVMSHINNNVGPGINIVVVNGDNGTVDTFAYLNTVDSGSEDILAYLKKIEPGKIVLLASFDDVTRKMTDEVRDVLQSMGSSLIKTLKSRDNWVFVGRVGATEQRSFEKISVNDPKTNVYENWPEAVEISGCFPQNSSRTFTQ